MKLIISPTSPYARKARIVLLEKNLSCDVVPVIPWENPSEVIDNTPLRKIPILLTDDGKRIVDSRVICEYLDEMEPSNRLLPTAWEARMDIKTQEAIAEGAMDACLTIVMSKRVAPDMKNDAWEAWLMEKVMNAIAYFDKNIGEYDEKNINIADITLACLLATLDGRMKHIDWHSTYPSLSRWARAIYQRPSFIDTQPKD